MANTLCIRCGKTRIVAKSWDEYIGTSLVTYTTTVCPDSQCQKIVDEEFAKKKDKIDTIHRESLKRREETRTRIRKERKKKFAKKSHSR